jgi:hypothetical protein
VSKREMIFEELLQQIDNLNWEQQEQILDKIYEIRKMFDPHGTAQRYKQAEKEYYRYQKAEQEEGKPLGTCHYEIIMERGTVFDVYYTGATAIIKETHPQEPEDDIPYFSEMDDFDADVNLGLLDIKCRDDGSIVLIDYTPDGIKELDEKENPGVISLKTFYDTYRPENNGKTWTWRGGENK